MIGWLLAIVVFAGICMIPLGIQLSYDVAGPKALLLVGPFRLPLFKKKNKGPVKKQEQNSAEKKVQTSRNKWGVDDFISLLRVLLDFLSELRCKLVVSDLELRLVLGSGDPYNVGIQHGRAWAVLSNLMPLLENVFHIKKRNLQVQTDFMAIDTVIVARADVTVPVWCAIWLALKYGLRGFKAYFSIVNKKKVVQ